MELIETPDTWFNIQTIDGRMKRSEFIVASAQQQKAIACFTAFSSQRHLVLLTGAAGTGKTVVALQVANNLVQELEVDAEPRKGPLLVVFADYSFERILSSTSFPAGVTIIAVVNPRSSSRLPTLSRVCPSDQPHHSVSFNHRHHLPGTLPCKALQPRCL